MGCGSTDSERNFYDQLEILGQLPSKEGQKRAVKTVFGVMKTLMSPEESNLIENSLPSWLRTKWVDTSVIEQGNLQTDIINLIKSVGNYSYRGAAERILLGVMGSLVEIFDPTTKEDIQKALPVEMVSFWVQAKSCSLDATVGQYL
jgi:uncharacterized protein (DUF2267 family)